MDKNKKEIIRTSLPLVTIEGELVGIGSNRLAPVVVSLVHREATFDEADAEMLGGKRWFRPTLDMLVEFFKERDEFNRAIAQLCEEGVEADCWKLGHYQSSLMLDKDFSYAFCMFNGNVDLVGRHSEKLLLRPVMIR